MNKVLPFLLQRLALLFVFSIFVLHGLGVWRIPYVDRLDAWIYDAKLLSNAPKTKHPDIVIVDIDEPSLAAFGRWPWSRETMAVLTKHLTLNQQAAAVGFDIVFAEAESPASDLIFSSALENQPVVLGYYFTSDRAAHINGLLPSPVIKQSDRPFQVTHWTGYGANLGAFTLAAPQSGFINAISDPDGVIRSFPLIAEYRGQYYESMALALFRRVLAAKSTGAKVLSDVSLHFASDNPNYPHIDSLRLTSNQTQLDIPVDRAVAKLIPYRGDGGAGAGSGVSFRYISAADILLGRLAPGSLSNKVVLVGSSAPALEDLRVTPVSGTFPGVEVQANALAGLIDGGALSRPDYAMGFDLFQMGVIGATMLIFLPQLSALGAVFLASGLGTVIWLAHRYLFFTQGLVLPCAAVLILISLFFIVHVSEGFFMEGRRLRMLTQLFGSYVSPKWVSRMAKSGGDYSMQASNQVLTVLFCDMRGFTKLASTMPPLELQALLNSIFDRLSNVIQSHGGTIDKYMGDCVMAFWGAPEAQSDHADRALQCAVEMQQAISMYNAEQATKSALQIEMGIGINTGLMCVGDMGSSIRRSYTVVGEAVNLAARLEGLCKTYNQPIIVSRATKEATILGQFDNRWINLGFATVAGNDEPIPIFSL